VSVDDMQRDLALLAAIGANDQRSLRAVALSRHIPSIDHYELLDIPRAATRAQIVVAVEAMKKRYEPSTFPAVVREAVTAIQNRIEEALHTLSDAARRQTYDKLLQQRGRNADEVQRGMTRRSIAEQNFRRARDLSISGDYYGAIVLLKQAVKFAPDHAEAWNLLGACQERNPKWRRDAAESFQRALSIDPNFVDALISLGDLYRDQGLASRAQSCYDDVIKIAPDNQQAKSRLQALKKR
jgi:tetratricopeptide (TPR) repeat protein